MPSLKDLRGRIKTVKSTERITSAMKMVAAAKLKRAEERANKARPYAEKMEQLIGSLASNAAGDAPTLLTGKPTNKTHLLVVITSDRGLCGGFNSNMVRAVKKQITTLQAAGKVVKLLIIGRKGISLLKRDYQNQIINQYEEVTKPLPQFTKIEEIAKILLSHFHNGMFDECQLFYTHYKSALTQLVISQSLIPYKPTDANNHSQSPNPKSERPTNATTNPNVKALTEFDPDETAILESLLPQNLAVQIYRGVLESFASELGARMTAMDNATRNAKDLINRLTITYNRSRQAQITKELIEIISGAEAL